MFDCNVGVPINELRSYTLTSAILKVDIVCDLAMTSTLNVLMTELHDRLYNQCIGNTSWFSIFIYPTGLIRVCKIRFASTGENRGKPCLVCKNIRILHGCEVRIENSVPRLCRVMQNSDPEGRNFLSAPNTHVWFFFLHTLFILKVAFITTDNDVDVGHFLKLHHCDLAMTST